MGYQQEAATAAYPPPPTSYPEPGQAYPTFVAPPPPAGYPTKDAPTNPQHARIETRSRGDGFWRGCCAALCCCCALETCF